ncbi:MAG: hypothetical protein GXO90_08615 [FCB group bacterium]|nr:hypothetical protein [FCB group bacterium]
MMRPNLDRLWSIAGLCFFISLSTLSFAQDEYDINGEQTFWDDYSDTTDYYSDDSLYYEDDSLYYGDDSLYYYGDDSLYYEDTGTEYTGSDYYDENGEPITEGDLTDIELADQARKMGWSITFSGSSPGYVSHALNTYNSKTDYRVGVEFPMLMQMFGVRFRFGAEFGTFSFSNYLPVGGKYAGNTIVGLLSFPAGPGQVKVGYGQIGGYSGFIAENSYGFSIGNVMGLRFGVRSTTSFGVKNSKSAHLGTTSWMDGFVTLGFNL